MQKKPRGTASMDSETVAKIARAGGLAISNNRVHMSNIGRIGGKAVALDRKHMSEIGRKGGLARRKVKQKKEESL